MNNNRKPPFKGNEKRKRTLLPSEGRRETKNGIERRAEKSLLPLPQTQSQSIPPAGGGRVASKQSNVVATSLFPTEPVARTWSGIMKRTVPSVRGRGSLLKGMCVEVAEFLNASEREGLKGRVRVTNSSGTSSAVVRREDVRPLFSGGTESE